MLLRASGEAIGEKVDLNGAVGGSAGRLSHGDLLVAFAEAATRGSDELAGLRKELLEAVGPEAFVEAAATVGAFNGLVRVADATGIPLEEDKAADTADFRAALGIDDFASVTGRRT